jgi:hypothetical protein
MFLNTIPLEYLIGTLIALLLPSILWIFQPAIESRKIENEEDIKNIMYYNGR